MILIDNKIISDDVVSEQFICNLNACKGACCVLGESGAALEEEELGILEDIYDDVLPYMTEAGKQAIAEQGHYLLNPDGEYTPYATPLIDGQACAYIHYDELGIAGCAIQKAYLAGDVDWIKPISCHLYPIRVNKYADFEAVNYNRWDICKPACSLGKKHKVPVYAFLKEPLIRKYGEDFYEQLDQTAKYLEKNNIE